VIPSSAIRRVAEIPAGRKVQPGIGLTTCFARLLLPAAEKLKSVGMQNMSDGQVLSFERAAHDSGSELRFSLVIASQMQG
jgi:hypothetical protein